MIPLALFQIGLGDAIAAGSGNLFFHFFAHLGADKKRNTAECLFSLTVPGYLHMRTAPRQQQMIQNKPTEQSRGGVYPRPRKFISSEL
jgi:hypothetical protein